jgi:alpha-amylase/alpha-mannosidase (GH57 family)
MGTTRLRVILLWHMHQPEYRDPLDGRFLAPWVYLHALKDYSDMLAHLERQPGARAVFNLTPVLLDQIEACVERLNNRQGAPIGDDLLDALRMPVLGLEPDRRAQLVRECLRAQRGRMIERFPHYRHLAQIADFALQHPAALDYLGDAFAADLLVWYHLAWMGEFVREDDPRLQRMLHKGSGFTAQDRMELLQVIHDVLAGLLPRFAALLAQGRIELCTSPHTHPILPLLLAFETAHEAQPEAALPSVPAYPGGATRARVQLASAAATHRARFGTSAAGCWPSEAALSEASLDLIDAAGFSWCAASEATLRRSLAGAPGELHRPWRLRDAGPAIFFRDDGLSNLIGFTYKDWAAEDAVADLIAHLERIASAPGDGAARVVTIALDGENAWEHYPENGREFLAGLYRRLLQHPGIELTTPSRCLADPQIPIGRLEGLVAGSWVHGDLATWIGHADKNRAWEMLVDAKRSCDACATLSPQALCQLAVCEGSDWFWWPGDYNPAPLVLAFERLYRLQLAALYRLIGREPPEYLAHVFSHGGAGDDPLAVLRPLRP